MVNYMKWIKVSSQDEKTRRETPLYRPSMRGGGRGALMTPDPPDEGPGRREVDSSRPPSYEARVTCTVLTPADPS